jgi:hypothetical protein
LGGWTNSESLVVSCGLDAQSRLPRHRQFGDRDQVTAPRFRAEDGEIVDLSQVVAPDYTGVWMMSVRATCVKDDGSASQPTGLALHAGKARVDHKVIPRVFPEGDEELIPFFLKGEHDRER